MPCGGYSSTSIMMTVLPVVNLGDTGLTVSCVWIHCKLLQGCPLPTPNPEVTPVSVSSVVQVYFLLVCFLCLDAGVCSGICVYFTTNANVYDPIMSARDWKLAILWLFGQDRIIGFN